eukprot:scaffold105281_cov10-Tisochrysis_lutea.AAC.1
MQEFVRKDIIEWLNFLRNDIGFDGWRFDFVRGWPGHFAKQYIEATNPAFALGEYWDCCEYVSGGTFDASAVLQGCMMWIHGWRILARDQSALKACAGFEWRLVAHAAASRIHFGILKQALGLLTKRPGQPRRFESMRRCNQLLL